MGTEARAMAGPSRRQLLGTAMAVLGAGLVGRGARAAPARPHHFPRDRSGEAQDAGRPLRDQP
ncbi:MAG: hypothetical protein OJI70_02360, partial [Zavarzinia sp.]|nr:hypothetical protein [Zavarzinia sp.]